MSRRRGLALVATTALLAGLAFVIPAPSTGTPPMPASSVGPVHPGSGLIEPGGGAQLPPLVPPLLLEDARPADAPETPRAEALPPAPGPATTTASSSVPATTSVPPAAPPSTSSSTTVPAPATTVPAPATTTPSPAPRIVWSADNETGDTSQWDGVWISGDAESRIVDAPVHGGRYADALTIFDADGNGSSPGVRMTYQGRGLADKTDPENLPTEAYYSVWYFVPQHVTVSWWNIFQWKTGYDDGSGRTARALYWHDLDDYGDELYLELQTRVNGDGQWVAGWANTLAVAPVPIPIGQWFHLESYYRWSATGNGRITTWLDGAQIWDVAGLTTEFDWPFDVYKREWTVNNYADDTTPATHTIYVDDAAVSRTRLGPGGGG